MANRMLCSCLLAMTASGLLGHFSRLLAAGESEADVARLVRQLGAESFRQREQATRELVHIGVPAKQALLAGLKSHDAEIRSRCRRLLVIVLELDCLARIEAFAADIEGKLDHGLAGWDRYRQVIGEDAACRQLFVEMQREESTLLETAAADKASTSHALEARCLEIQRTLYQTNVEERKPVAVGSVAALLFVAGNPEISVADRMGSYLNNFCYQPAPQLALAGGDEAAPLKRVLGQWISRASGTVNGYQSLDLAMRFNLRQGLEPAMSMVRNHAGQQPYLLQNAILAVGKFGGREHVSALESLLENTGQVGTFRSGTASIKTEVRDIALAVMLHLTGQSLKDYGLKRVQTNTQTLFIASSLGFEDGDDRDTALKKWRDWASNHLAGKSTN